MNFHSVRVYPSKQLLPRDQQLAWKLAALAADPVPVEAAVAEMIVNRIVILPLSPGTEMAGRCR